MKKKFVLGALAVATIGGVGLFGVSHAYADTTPINYPPIVQKIASKFGLNISDVQAVFNQDRQDRQAAMEKRFEDRLTQLVTDGKITDAQKQLIIAKHQEMQSQMKANFANLRNLTPAQRQAAFQKQQQDLQDWAKQNGIDPQYLFGGFGRFGKFGGRHMGMMNDQPLPSPSTASAQ